MIFLKCKSKHIILLLKALQCLSIVRWIKPKLLHVAYTILHDLGSAHLSELILHHASSTHKFFSPRELLSVLLTTSLFLPQGLDTCHSFSLVHSFLRSLNTWPLLIIQISDQMSFYQKGFPWPPNQRKPFFFRSLTFMSLCFIFFTIVATIWKLF